MGELKTLQFPRCNKNPTVVFLLRSLFFDDFLSSCPLDKCVVLGGMWLARIISWVVQTSFWDRLLGLFWWPGLNTWKNMNNYFILDILINVQLDGSRLESEPFLIQRKNVHGFPFRAVKRTKLTNFFASFCLVRIPLFVLLHLKLN
jgi:hypothetical protein